MDLATRRLSETLDSKSEGIKPSSKGLMDGGLAEATRIDFALDQGSASRSGTDHLWERIALTEVLS